MAALNIGWLQAFGRGYPQRRTTSFTSCRLNPSAIVHGKNERSFLGHQEVVWDLLTVGPSGTILLLIRDDDTSLFTKSNIPHLIYSKA